MGSEVERKTRPNGDYYSSDPAIRARELQEDGKIGGHFGKLGGRPRKPRASEKVAEQAQKEADSIIAVFKDLVNSESEKTRLAAANSWLAVEQEETRLRLQEERQEFDIGQASREELLNYLREALASGSPLANQLGVIDGTATDIDSELGELGHGDSEEAGSRD
jgi:hypothetical protein